MKVERLEFGSVTIDGKVYDEDIVIDNGIIRKRKKSVSKKYREKYGHTPLSADEEIPWKCKHLVIGTGHSSSLPVMKKVLKKALKKGVEVHLMSTPEAVKHINDPDTNLILHLTC